MEIMKYRYDFVEEQWNIIMMYREIMMSNESEKI